jgi:hypothetical protein
MEQRLKTSPAENIDTPPMDITNHVEESLLIYKLCECERTGISDALYLPSMVLGSPLGADDWDPRCHVAKLTVLPYHQHESCDEYRTIGSNNDSGC